MFNRLLENYQRYCRYYPKCEGFYYDIFSFLFYHVQVSGTVEQTNFLDKLIRRVDHWDNDNVVHVGLATLAIMVVLSSWLYPSKSTAFYAQL